MKKLLILISSILIAMIFWEGFIYIKMNKSYTEIINMNWSIELPKPYEEIYSIDSGPSFHGDGERYHIFDYKNKDDIELSLKWKDDKNLSMESKIGEVLDNLSVSQEYMPKFESKYQYYSKREQDSSTIYLIFIPDIKRLYVIEDIL